LELETYPWIELTSCDEWDSHNARFAEAKDHLEYEGNTIPLTQDCNICPVETDLIQLTPILPMYNLYQAVHRNIKVASVSTISPRSTISLQDKVSRTFGVGLETAKCTLKALLN
jgi:hypothetical protein